MNRRPTGSLSLAKAISGFLKYKAAEGLSPTLRRSERDLKLRYWHSWILLLISPAEFAWPILRRAPVRPL